MAAWSYKTLKFCEKFLRFLEKRPLTVKISKFCFEGFHRLTDRRCCVQILWNLADEKSAKSCVIYQIKKFRLPLKLSLLRGSCPKSARVSLNSTQSDPDFIEIGSLSGEVIAERVNTAESLRKVNPTFGRGLAWSRLTINTVFDHESWTNCTFTIPLYCTTIIPTLLHAPFVDLRSTDCSSYYYDRRSIVDSK